ncbi:MAG: hypothetical protein M3220_16785 [Chloroflexota bacterium]|nr:hypothetical protein [Chloroflexota bacterium]
MTQKVDRLSSSGTLTNLALLAGLFMNLNFVLAGVVNLSAFYIVIQGTLLSANAGTTLGGDSILARYTRAFVPGTSSSSEAGNRSLGKWFLLLSGIACTVTATLVVPYIRDFGPHSVEDPAMLLFILSMLGAMLAGIQFVRTATAQSST